MAELLLALHLGNLLMKAMFYVYVAGGLAFPQARATVGWSAEALPREPVAAGPWGPRRPGG